jgi:hypothetical protein
MTNSAIPPITAPIPQTPSSGQVVQIQTLPEALQNISRATRVEGEVIAQNKDGSTRIRTNDGDIDIKVRGRQPHVGQRMEVEIPTGNPPRTATIRNVPAPTPVPATPQTPPATAPAGQVPATPPPPIIDTVKVPPVSTRPADTNYQPQNTGAHPAAPATPVATPPPTFNIGQIVRIVPMTNIVAEGLDSVIATASDKTPLQTNIIANKAESGLISTLLQAVKSSLPQGVANSIPGLQNIEVKPETAGSNISILPQGTAKLSLGIMQPPSPQSIPGLAGITENIIASTLPSNLVLEAKIIAIKSPSGQTQIFSPPLNNNTPATDSSADTTTAITKPLSQTALPSSITVNVTGLTAQKMPIISMAVAQSAPLQNFVLQAYAPMAEIGSQITITPHIAQTSSLSNAAVMPPAWRSIFPLMQPSALWPVMDDIFQSFAQTTPQAAQILGRIIPSPGTPANMGPAILLFAAALRSGDLQTWMGEKKLDMLQKLGKGALLQSLSSETSSLTRANETANSDWRSLPIPMLWQNEISKVMFHVRKEPAEDGSPNGESGTRFIMDLDLTRMGEVQLDGLVRGNRLDLIVRTKEAVSNSMQEAMKKAYADALHGTQIYGEMGFQSDIKNWMVTSKENAYGEDL